MHSNARLLLLPALFVISGVLAQSTAELSSGTPDVTYPADNSFVFCSSQDCTGTCEAVDVSTVTREEGDEAPNDMGFLSIYWYNPDDKPGVLETCVGGYYDCDAVNIGPNACYNLFNNGVPTDFYQYMYFLDLAG